RRSRPPATSPRSLRRAVRWRRSMNPVHETRGESVRLMRAALPQGDRMLGSWNGTTAVATVAGREFDDLPELLEACEGDAGAIAPGATVEVGDEQFLPVAANPRKIVCIGLN